MSRKSLSFGAVSILHVNEAPHNYMFIPVAQYYRPDLALIVRTSGEPSDVFRTVQSEVKALDGGLPLFDMVTVEEHLQFSTFIPRMAGTLLGLFGGLALLLAVVGLYGVVAHSVVLRTHEIGVRMALGAGRREILGLVVRQGAVLIAIGLSAGLGLAAAAGRTLGAQLTGVTGTDPYSYAASVAILLTVATMACVVPARRACALDPIRALRRD